jgi:hypothetical protein
MVKAAADRIADHPVVTEQAQAVAVEIGIRGRFLRTQAAADGEVAGDGDGLALE